MPNLSGTAMRKVMRVVMLGYDAKHDVRSYENVELDLRAFHHISNLDSETIRLATGLPRLTTESSWEDFQSFAVRFVELHDLTYEDLKI